MGIFKALHILRISKTKLLLFFLLLYIGFEKNIITQEGITILFQTILDFLNFIIDQIGKHVNIFGSNP